MELVRVVTGHRTVEIVYKHYFRSRREELRAAIEKHMPALLTAPTPGSTVEPGVEEMISSASEKNAWETLQKLQGMISKKQPEG